MSRHEEVELEKSVRRLRESFYGNIPIDKAATLMRRYWNNYQNVVREIILMKDEGDDLGENDRWSLENDPVVKNVVEKLQNEEREKEKEQSEASNDPRSSKKSGVSGKEKLPEKDKRKEPSRGAMTRKGKLPHLGDARSPKANKGPREDKDIQELGEKFRLMPLTEKNKRMFDRAQQNQMPSAEHQFACERCDKSWWRRVPERKRVSRCRRCRQKYDPVPPDKMWGIAEFMCNNCARSFKGFGGMDLGSPCYSCRCIVFPTRILPPRKHLFDSGRKRHQHSCLAEDCYNRQEPYVADTECVHPVSRKKNGKPQVVNPSEHHISSGSTVNTCLSQGSLIEDLFDIIMEDIREEDETEDGDSGSSTSS